MRMMGAVWGGFVVGFLFTENKQGSALFFLVFWQMGPTRDPLVYFGYPLAYCK